MCKPKGCNAFLHTMWSGAQAFTRGSSSAFTRHLTCLQRCANCGSIINSNLPQPQLEYQLHPAKNIFHCRGRFITGPDLALCRLTWALNIIFGGLSFGFDAPYLWENVSPALPLVTAYACLLTLISLFVGSTSDPGIVPRGEQAELILDGEDDSKRWGPPVLSRMLHLRVLGTFGLLDLHAA